ncbi:hypothetical protein IAR55_003666 [Kwoniella newhampshirensis]|uniref:GATA-type domain-containing protein n=1 Tax=Kwoniella newhampshirensis TaxID=1651941 RepID=A0AAW0YN19_9TREE
MPAPAMSQLDQTSAILGEYMLKGWTLTDLHCSDCRSTPLMREPAAIAQREGRERIQFCALCDGRPEGQTQSQTEASLPPAIHQSTPSSSTFTSTSLPSTAPRDSHLLSQQAQHRKQSDDTVSSISNLLLKGYALLGENCPNPTCRGIPLVGYPRRPDGSKDGRKMCVSCDGRWVAESAIESGGMKIVSSSDESGMSPRSKRRRELYGLVVEEKGKGKEKVVETKDFEKKAKESEEKLVGQTKSVEREVEDGDFEEDNVETPATKNTSQKRITTHTAPDTESPLGLALSHTTSSLSTTLHNLSASLERYAAHPPTGRGLRGEDDSGKWFVDLKLHTEAIKDVLGVIGQVEQARRLGY